MIFYLRFIIRVCFRVGAKFFSADEVQCCGMAFQAARVSRAHLDVQDRSQQDMRACDYLATCFGYWLPVVCTHFSSCTCRISTSHTLTRHMPQTTCFSLARHSSRAAQPRVCTCLQASSCLMPYVFCLSPDLKASAVA